MKIFLSNFYSSVKRILVNYIINIACFLYSLCQVRSISQLRRELSGTDLFYIESAKKRSTIEKPISQSLESVHTRNNQRHHQQQLQNALVAKNVETRSDQPMQGAPKRTDSAPNLELNTEQQCKHVQREISIYIHIQNTNRNMRFRIQYFFAQL